MDGNGLYFSVFYYFCCIKWVSMDGLERQLRAEKDPNLDIKKDIRICDGVDRYWKYMLQDNI